MIAKPLRLPFLLSCPSHERDDRLSELSAFEGKRVLHPWRDFMIRFPLDDAHGLELLQAVSQRLRSDFPNTSEHIVEAQPVKVADGDDDGERPFLAQGVRDVFQGARAKALADHAALF